MPFQYTILDLDEKKIEELPYSPFVYLEQPWTTSEIISESFSRHFVACIANLLENMEMTLSDLLSNSHEFRKMSFLSKLKFAEPSPMTDLYLEGGASLNNLYKNQMHSSDNESWHHFTSLLQTHPEFQHIMVHHNVALFQEIEKITSKRQPLRSDCYKIIECINQLNIPGISSITLYSTLSDHSQRLERIDFPKECIHASFLTLLDHSDPKSMTSPRHYSEFMTWISKIEYIYRAFKDQNYIKKYHEFREILDTISASLEEFHADISYLHRQSKKQKGLYTRSAPAPGLLTSKPPSLYRSLMLLSGHEISPHDIQQLEVSFGFKASDWSSWSQGPSAFFQERIDKFLSQNPAEFVFQKKKKQTTPPSHHEIENEMDRRIPKEERERIQSQVATVSEEQLCLFLCASNNPETLLHASSFIHDRIFPFAARAALHKKLISTHQFGSMMTLWGNVHEILSMTSSAAVTMPEYIALFDAQGAINPRAKELLFNFSMSTTLPYLIKKSKNDLTTDFFEEARKLLSSEQGFWLIKNKGGLQSPHRATRTIRDEISVHLKIDFLDFPSHSPCEIITTCGVKQAFLNAAFEHAVTLNPVIGISSVEDILMGTQKRSRDIALPFPGVELPKVADNLPAPRLNDFMWHDYYHALRASRLTPEETSLTLALGHRFANMQRMYHAVLRTFKNRHACNQHFLRAFFTHERHALPQPVLNILLEYARKQFNQEIRMINFLKKLSSLAGRLKFRHYDAERGANGTSAESLPMGMKMITSFYADCIVIGERRMGSHTMRFFRHVVDDVLHDTSVTLKSCTVS